MGSLTFIFPYNTAQKMKFSIKDFFRKCDLLKKSLIGNFIFVQCKNKILDFVFIWGNTAQ